MIKRALWEVKLVKINPLKFCHYCLVLCFGLIGAFAHAGQQTPVYRCQQGDVVVFSQVPCDDKQSVVNVKPSQGKGVTTEQAKQKLKTEQDAVAGYLRRQQIEQQIADNHKRIAKLEQQLKAQLNQLKQQRFRTETLRDEAYNQLEERFQHAVKARHKAIVELNEQLKALEGS